jgi:hypothetical protein
MRIHVPLVLVSALPPGVEVRRSRAKDHPKRHHVNIRSHEAILRTPAYFRHWTSICYRSTENAFLSARLLWGDLDDPNRARERIDHRGDKDSQQADEEDGYENLDEDIRQREVKAISHRVVDTLRVYVGDRKFDTRLRFWVDNENDPTRSHML